jgi:hypothetical protein
MTSAAILALFAVTAAGAGLIGLGLRGRRIDDHPVCSRCRFDLCGTYPARVVCPECGGDLEQPRAVRTGQRRRVRWALAVGGLGLVTGGLPLAVVGAAAAVGADLNSYKPAGLLLWEGRTGGAEASAAAAGELLDRMVRGVLSEADTARAVAAALDIQGDRSRPWNEAWGDVVERAQVDGRLSEADLQRFYNQSVVFELETRPTVRLGDPVPVAVRIRESRLGRNWTVTHDVYFRSALLADLEATLTEPSPSAPVAGSFEQTRRIGGGFAVMGSASAWSPGAISWTGGFLVAIPDGVPAGRARLRVCLLSKGSPMGPRTIPATLDETDPTARRHELAAEFTLIRDDAQGIEIINPTPELNRDLLEAIRIEQLTASNGAHQAGIGAVFTLEQPPVPAAFRVYMRLGERDQYLGWFSTGRGIVTDWDTRIEHPAGGRNLFNLVYNIEASRADLVLRPDPSLAVRTLDLTRVYGGELIVPDVPIRWSTGSAIPQLPPEE